MSAISAIVNSGDGRGLLVLEVYSPALDDPERAYRWEGHFVRFARDAERLVPAARGKNLFFFATYIDLGSWCDYPAPEADVKAHYAHFLHSIATSNVFADVVSGLALGGLGNGEEETVRWFARCVRHYAVEGRTDDLAERYGFAYLPKLVRNCDIMWFDYTSKGEYGKSWRDWDSVRLLKMARGLQPQIIVDNRLDLLDTEDGFDFVTPEQFKVSEWPKWKGKKTYWETCQTFSGSWGYHRDESTWKSPHQLIELLVHTVSFGGNLIMNVGPTARGEFDERAQDRLAAIGRWMHWNSRSIYGCTQAPEEFARPEGTLMTYNPERKRLYVHLVDYPMGALAFEFHDRVAYAQFLHDGSEVKLVAPEGARHGQMGEMRIPGKVVLPVVKPNVEVPVIEFFLK